MLLNAPEPLGNLTLRTVYFRHDGPRIFSVERASDHAYLIGVCVDEDDQSVRYVYWVVAPGQLDEVEAGLQPLRESLLGSSEVYLATERYSDGVWSIAVSATEASELTRAYLPAAGELLTSVWRQPPLPEPVPPLQVQREEQLSHVPSEPPTNARSPFLEPFSLDRINDAALNDGHYYAAIELSPELPTRPSEAVRLQTLGALAGPVDSLILALGVEANRGSRAGLTVKNAAAMEVYGAMAASFVLILRTPDQEALFDGEVSRQALRGVTSILASAHDPELFVTELSSRSRSVRRKVRELLSSVVDQGAGLSAIVTDGHDISRGSVSVAQAAASRDALVDAPPTVSTLPLASALLTALNLRRKTFELWDRASGLRYTGTFSDDVLDQVDGLSVSQTDRFYRAELRVTTPFAPGPDEPTNAYRLEAIQPIESPVT